MTERTQNVLITLVIFVIFKIVLELIVLQELGDRATCERVFTY